MRLQQSRTIAPQIDGSIGGLLPAVPEHIEFGSNRKMFTHLRYTEWIRSRWVDLSPESGQQTFTVNNIGEDYAELSTRLGRHLRTNSVVCHQWLGAIDVVDPYTSSQRIRFLSEQFLVWDWTSTGDAYVVDIRTRQSGYVLPQIQRHNRFFG